MSPQHLLGRFNGFVKSVILRISEARDLGEMNRFKFYDHMKTYHRFTRSIEHVSVVDDIGISMGVEVVQPKAGPQANQVLERRFTNVWRSFDGDWRMICRHANVIVGEQDMTPSKT